MDLTRLREYQLEDAKFLAAHKHGAACFGEQRTGKTPTALAACLMRGYTKLLIICPASAVYFWTEEFTNWTGLPCVACVGTKAQRETIIKQWECGLVVSYDTLKPTQRSAGTVHQILEQYPHAVILDEAHRIKNGAGARASAQAKAVFLCSHIPYRLALTGTPAPNRSYDVWSILHFLYPQVYRSYWKFIEDHYVTQLQTARNGRRYKDILYFKPGMKVRLQHELLKIATMRKRKDVMTWLPEKDYHRVKLPLTKEQQKYINELETVWETEHIVTQGVLDRLIRYRQICLAPELLGLKGSSPKMDWVLQFLQDYPDRPVIVFSKFTSFIKLLAPYCKKAGVLIGATPIKKRKEYCEAFQNGTLNVLLVNIDVGKESLTLDRAECIIFTDKYPPIGDILQAEDRFIATIKEHADKPHTIVELMMKDSYDEQLYKLLDQRKVESDIINNYKEHLERRRTHGNST